MHYRIDGVADGHFGDLSAARFITLCERTFAFHGAMRFVAEAQAESEGDDPGQLRQQYTDDEDLDEVEDEVEPQDLGDLSLGMEVRDGASGDGAGLGG